MDYNLLRSWLGLPPGPWPPNHYTVLGFPPGRVDATAVEPRVMERMDRLRQHQLIHPELVTEGMNQLAQALITLTDPGGKAAYDADLGIPPASSPLQTLPPSPSRPTPPPVPANRPTAYEVIEPVFDDDAFSDDAEPPGGEDAGDVTQVIVSPGGGVAAYEVIHEEPPPSLGPDLIPETTPDEPLPEDVFEGHTAEPLERPEGLVDLSARRQIYAQLALVRHGLRAWERLRATLTDPQEPLDRPGRVLALLEAVYHTRPLLPELRGVVGEVGKPGGMVAAVVNHPLVLDTFRRLLPDQRQALAIDWRRGHAELQKEYARLRGLARTNRLRPLGGRGAPILLRWIMKVPEIMLAALAALAFLIALVRGAHHR